MSVPKREQTVFEVIFSTFLLGYMNLALGISSIYRLFLHHIRKKAGINLFCHCSLMVLFSHTCRHCTPLRPTPLNSALPYMSACSLFRNLQYTVYVRACPPWKSSNPQRKCIPVGKTQKITVHHWDMPKARY